MAAKIRRIHRTRATAAVFDLVIWWKAEDRAVSRARWALRLQGLDLPSTDEPFAAIISCTSDPKKKGGQANAIQVVARAAVRSGVQIDL